MSKNMLLCATALRTFAACGLACTIANPALAQQAPATETVEPAPPVATPEVLAKSDTPVKTDEAIVVTGSRIKRPNLESTVPIISVTGEEFFQQGQNNIGDSLNELPQLRSTRQQSNSNLQVGTTGLNLLDLRGLGTQRTLVLVNGRRHVASDILVNAVSPDINTIPNDLIERVDIVTGGNSAVYGSDAIAGVVNFILKRDFDGLQVRGKAGVSEEGFGGNQYVSAMYGKNFSDGRGNITLHGEFAHQDRVYGSEVPFIRRNDGLFVTDIDGVACTGTSATGARTPAGCDVNVVNGGDGIPDRTFFRDIRQVNVSYLGLVPIVQPAGAGALCGTGIPSGTGATLPYNCNFIFQAGGIPVPVTGARFGQGIIGSIAGGNSTTGREGHLVTLLPLQERYNFNLLAHYEVSEALEPFVEAKFARTITDGGNAGPTSVTGSFGQFDFRERFRLDNPFLGAGGRTTLANAILTSGFNTDVASRNPLTAAQRADINSGVYRFVNARQLIDIGERKDRFRRDTYRVVAGIRGDFNDDWSYEVSANYGKMKEDGTSSGYVDKQRFALSLDAGRNPATGQIQCRSQFDPASAIPFQNIASPATNPAARAAEIAAYASRLANDIAACVPYNPFGLADNSAAAKYFVFHAHNRAELSQFVASAFVGGDSSQLFELPGGPVRFVVGGEYRTEKAEYVNDPFIIGNFTNAVNVGLFNPPKFEVKEAYGEIQIPVLKDTPFFEELTLSGAARVADYKGATGTVWAYNAGVDWSPIRGLRFRGNYGRAVRAPNYSETGFPVVPNFAPGFQDPCRAANIGQGTQYRAANCLADLGAALLNSPSFANIAAFSLPVLSGSNPDLVAETSDSYTLGAVAQPRFIPGLSLSVDYYAITVNKVITSVSAQNIANGCYDLPTLDNPFCSLFTRYRGAGVSGAGEIPGQIANNTLLQAPLNFAKRVRKGIDFEAAYRTGLGSFARLDTHLLYTHNLKNSNFENPTLPKFENRILGELGDPEDEFRWDLALTHGPFTVGYQMSYIGPMWTGFYEDFNSLQGRPPQNEDFADIRKYPAVFYHDVRFEWAMGPGGIGRAMNFFVGVDNLLDTDPPLGLQGNGERLAGGGNGSPIYRTRGRNYYAGFKARF
ncbi:MAG: TonB-dependent receptor [Sphingomonas sp.]|uniref:TonB-dependent receptor domain-containing protein n=1 Tax=Sphingomonas sp. TaxID=28214 RepID=UPI00182F6336|nr:TonB-dependent receptor [Sphingomonas sp.]MBA3666199.1 TonB-dependent receptor [Sphingomonas sp.]